MNKKLRTLLPYQKEALDWAKKESRIALFMEMRLGKTLIAIRWALSQMHPIKPGRILVVAPLSVLPTWKEELQKENYPSNLTFTLTGAKKRRLEMVDSSPQGFFLINYEGLRVLPELTLKQWDCIILDESTRIRNPKALITKTLLTRSEHIPSKAILSGLPAPESPLDYFTQFQFLHTSFMQCYNYWQFRKRYFALYGFDWIARPGILGEIKRNVHEKSFVLTRKQVSIGSRKVYEKRYVDMTPKQKKIYNQVEKEFAYSIKERNISESTKWIPVKFSWMTRIAGGFSPDGTLLSLAKAREIESLFKGELKQEQVIIWFKHNQELHAVGKYLLEKGISTLPITGETNLAVREHYISLFKRRKVKGLCVQLKCGKYGVDWSNASTSIYYSNSYDMEDRAQSEDRIVHPIKTEPLLYIDLVTKDTIDEDVIMALRDKNASSRYFMTNMLRHWLNRKGGLK